MISLPANTGARGIQTFVFANGQLYKAGTQRIVDSLSGHRAELALKNTAIKVWTACVTDKGIVFGRANTAVFDEQGEVREDVSLWALHGVLEGLDESVYVKQKLPQDELVLRFLEASAHVLDQLQLEELAETAKTLPTR